MEEALKQILAKLNVMDDKINVMDDKINVMDKRLNVIDDKMDVMDKRLNVIDDKIDVMDERFNVMDERFNVMDERFNVMDERFNVMEDKIGTLQDTVTEHGTKLDNLKLVTDGIMKEHGGMLRALLHNLEHRNGKMDVLDNGVNVITGILTGFDNSLQSLQQLKKAE